MSDQRVSGTVKWFNDNKGYGFIKPDDGGEDVFVHHAELERAGIDTLHDGEKVSFELSQGKKGHKAVSVQRG